MAKPLSLTLVAAATWLAPLQAQAHGNLEASGPFWSGALHFVISPLSLAALVGLCVALRGEVGNGAPFLAGAITTAAVALWAPMDLLVVAPVAAIVTGAIAALGLGLAGWPTALLGVVSGFCAGLALELDEPSVPGALGTAIAWVVIAAWVLVLMEKSRDNQHLRRAYPIACRVIGAWVATIGILVLALSVQRLVTA